MAFARYGAFWSNQKMERVAGDAFFFSLGPPPPIFAVMLTFNQLSVMNNSLSSHWPNSG
jgi:hypothetical protein